MSDGKKLTPMLQQYFDLKKEHQNAFLFFRLGDFYEMFGDDAVQAAKLLGITLTARQKGTENEIPMCGVPHHSAAKYISQLTQMGKRVALCEQVSDPNLPGIVQREVVKVITPGTSFDESVVNARENHYLAYLLQEKDQYAISFMDLSTGEFQLFQSAEKKDVQSLLYKLQASELLVQTGAAWDDWQLEHVSEWELPYFENPSEYLQQHFQVAQLSGFGITEYPLGIKAAAALLHYVKETQKTALDHIKNVTAHQFHQVMVLDESTIRNLELFHTAKAFQKEGSLIAVLDRTLTRMGARKIRQWLLAPLTNKEAIDARLDAVEELFQHQDLLTALQDELDQYHDIERLTGKIGCRSANARDLHTLRVNLLKIPQFKTVLERVQSNNLKTLRDQLKTLPELNTILEQRIHPEAPIHLNEGGMIADGFHPELDELRQILRNGKQWLLDYQERLRKDTEISTLKVKFNKVFGYHIEVSKAQANKVPEDFQIKQTLVNAHRYMSAELNRFAEKFLNAEERIKSLEFELFQETLELVLPFVEDIQKNARLIAELDVYQSFAQKAIQQHFIKPQMVSEKGVSIVDGRHPVIEALLSKQHQVYIANDTEMSTERQVMVLTGPNMSGKSSYLRQTALITLMAHIGSFVPASVAKIGLTDRIFTRVGAADDISSGQSTFMVEMTEAANILNNATERSLIIFDELGRGTSTYDGVSIAWAILEHVSREVGATTLFATHYHELIDVADGIENAFNASVAVSEQEEKVVFLRKVVDGGVSRSYGIEVARLAGLPVVVLQRAQQILSELEQDRAAEEQHLMGLQPSLFTAPQQPVQSIPQSVSQEDRKHQALLKRITELNPNDMTPIQALAELAELKNQIETEK